MFQHTAWTDGIERAARYRHEADTHRALCSAGCLPWSRQAASRALRRIAGFLSRFADRLATPQGHANPPRHTLGRPSTGRSTAHRA